MRDKYDKLNQLNRDLHSLTLSDICRDAFGAKNVMLNVSKKKAPIDLRTCVDKANHTKIRK